MSAEKIHADHERRAAEWFGLRPSNARICPRVVAGKHCRIDRDDLCPCQTHRVFDHPRIWLDADGRHVYTAESYGAEGADIAALTADMSALGLEVHLSGRSPWNPGYTLLIRITAPTDARKTTP